MIITVENFRSFSTPARFTINTRDGIQAFVGPNNSGKSNILRFFYELRDVFKKISAPDFALKETPFSYPREVADTGEVFSNGNSDGITITIQTGESIESGLESGRKLITPGQYLINIPRDMTRGPHFTISPYVDGKYGTFHDSGDHNGIPSHRLITSQHVIDLSTAKSAAEIIANSIYIGPYRNIVNVGGTTEYYDLAIGDRFIGNWSSAYSGSQKSQNLAARSLLDEVRSIFGYSNLDMPAGGGGLLTYVEGEPYRLDEHGAGLAQFIMVLFAVDQKRPTLVLIDEPELHLHPRLQLSFLNSVAARASHGTLFATHSLGLARTAADRQFSISRRTRTSPSQIREFHEVKNLSEVLGELSYAGNFDLGSRSILLIEGKTEYKTYREILRKYRADQDVTLLSLGGSTIIGRDAADALVELKRLSDRIYAAVDSDRPAAGASARREVREFEKVCVSLSIPILVYERRAIENYLIDPWVSEIQGLRALGPHDAVPMGWSKANNWRVARRMSASDFDKTDIGPFLRNVVLKNSAPDGGQPNEGA